MEIKFKNKIIGFFEQLPDGRWRFSKNVKKSKHWFFMTNSWGIDESFFKKDLLPVNSIISIYDEEERILYKTDAQTYKEHGKYQHHKPHGLQLLLALEHFSQSRDGKEFYKPEKEPEIIKKGLGI